MSTESVLSAAIIAKLVFDNAQSHATFLEGKNGYGVPADNVNPEMIAAVLTVVAWPVNDRKVAVTMADQYLPRYGSLLDRFIDDAVTHDMLDTAEIVESGQGRYLTW